MNYAIIRKFFPDPLFCMVLTNWYADNRYREFQDNKNRCMCASEREIMATCTYHWKEQMMFRFSKQNTRKLRKKPVKVRTLCSNPYYSGDILFFKPEPAFYFFPEAFSKYEQTKVECYLTSDYKSGYDSCNLGFCISEPGYYKYQEKGERRNCKKNIPCNTEHGF